MFKTLQKNLFFGIKINKYIGKRKKKLKLPNSWWMLIKLKDQNPHVTVEASKNEGNIPSNCKKKHRTGEDLKGLVQRRLLGPQLGFIFEFELKPPGKDRCPPLMAKTQQYLILT